MWLKIHKKGSTVILMGANYFLNIQIILFIMIKFLTQFIHKQIRKGLKPLNINGFP